MKIKRIVFKTTVNTLLLGISVIAGIVMVEIYLRFTRQIEFTDSDYPRGMQGPGSPSQMTPNFKGEFPKSDIHGKIEINSKGLRDTERSYRKEGGLRILGLGDSFAFGHGVEFEESYLYLVEKALRKEYQCDFEIIKAGVPGKGPDFYLEYFDIEGYRYSPDYIMLNLFLGNDIDNIVLNKKPVADILLQPESDGVTPPKAAKKYRPKKPKSIGWKSYLKQNLRLYSFLIHRLKHSLRFRKILYNLGLSTGLPGAHIIEFIKDKPSLKFEEKFQRLFEILDEFRKRSKIIICLIPTQEQVYPPRLEKALQFYNFPPQNVELVKTSKLILDYCQKHDLPCIDLLPTLIAKSRADSASLYYLIDAHLTPAGSRHAADDIIKKLPGHLDMDICLNPRQLQTGSTP